MNTKELIESEKDAGAIVREMSDSLKLAPWEKKALGGPKVGAVGKIDWDGPHTVKVVAIRGNKVDVVSTTRKPPMNKMTFTI